MRRIRRTPAGISLIEVLMATAIAGILAGLAFPTVLSARRNAIALQAHAELRLVDIAVNASCGRGRCGPFMPPGAFGGIVTEVPDALKEFLPSGYRFASDTNVYALELESWEFFATGGSSGGLPVCVAACGEAAPAIPTQDEDTGFTNTAGYTAPPTIFVTVTIVTKDGDMAQRLYDKAGGTAPVYLPAQQVWRYSYPVLVGVPAVA